MNRITTGASAHGIVRGAARGRSEAHSVQRSQRSTLFRDKAEAETGITQQQVSRWRNGLKRTMVAGAGVVRRPLCPIRHPPQPVAACLSSVARRSSLAWAPNHARPFTAHRFGRRQSGRQKRARKPTGSPSRRGTSACSAFRVRRSRLPRWATRSTPGLAISK